MRRRRFLGAAAAAAVAAGAFLVAPPALRVAAAAPSAADAEAFIRTLADDVLVLLKKELPPAERREELQGLLNRATNLDLVGRLVLGRYWRSASPEQREEYTDLFRRFIMENLASRLDSYSGRASYDVTGARAVDDRDALVSTRITRPGSPPLKVDWRLRETDGRLAIIDVIAEGVSMVVSQRAEFASIVGSRGMDGLLNRLREQVGASPA